MSEEKGELDVTAGARGVGVHTKGYRLMDMVCLASAFGVGYLCMAMFNHDAAGAERTKSVTTAMTEQTKEIRETNQNTRQLIQTLQESNCLNRLTPQQKTPDNIEFCRRLGAGR